MPDTVVNLEGANRRRVSLTPLSAGRATNIKGVLQQDSKAAPVKIPAMHSAASKTGLTAAATMGKPRLMLENINEILGIHNVQARFFVDSRTDRRVARLHEKPSNKIIRQVPTQEFLERVAHTRKYIGLVFDKKV